MSKDVVLAADLGGTNLRMAAVDRHGKILYRTKRETPRGERAEEIVQAGVEGPEVNIAFNAKYVTDVLKNIDSETFHFSLNQSLNPAAVREENNDTFTYIVTPVRTAH